MELSHLMPTEILIKLIYEKNQKNSTTKRNIIMIFDTSVIIELFYANILEKLNNYKNSIGYNIEFILPNIVLEELKKDRMISKIDNILKQIFKIYDVPIEIMKEIKSKKPTLELGELSVLAIATLIRQKNPSSSVIVIIDEKKGRKVAEELGLEKHGTLWIIIQFKKQKVISEKEAIEIVKGLPYRGFYLDKEKLEQAIERIKIDC